MLDINVYKKELESKRWLAENDGPFPEVLGHWQSTYCLREIDKQNDSFLDVENIFNQWPILTKSNVRELVSFGLLIIKKIIITKNLKT